MKKLLMYCLPLLFAAGSAIYLSGCTAGIEAPAPTVDTTAMMTDPHQQSLAEPLEETDPLRELYDRLGVGETVGFEAFQLAMKGREKVEGIKKDEVLVVIDFTKASTEERMCVIDLELEKVLHTSLVAHGRNSGGNYATSFSNTPGSYKSSLGFFLTEGTYWGRNGYSLVINGLEKGINDKAKERAIVIHGSNYVNHNYASSYGRLGRSLGCPALPTAKNKEIINAIKGGALLYIYADNTDYMSKSSLI